MTPEQYSRWYRFALRMAHRGFPRIPRKSRKKVAGMVKDFFRSLSNYVDDYVSRVVDWDNTEDCDKCKEAVLQKNYAYTRNCGCSFCPGDVAAMMNEHWNPYYWDSQDGQYRRWNETWQNRVECCLRAGLDLAAAPSCGVVGFEICDLRRMYRSNVPAWISEQYTDKRTGMPANFNQGECAVGIWL